MFTRKDYLSNKCTRHEYYMQFAASNLKNILFMHIGEDRIKASKDASFNDIPLKLWDNLPMINYTTAEKMREAGDYPTLAGKVCIYKAIAEEVRDEDKS